ncbi:MAG TPA: DUF3052 domain-containing protein [Acidimicrobiales bacterium]
MESTAGYSGTPLPKKLGIKPGMHVALLHAPEGFEATLGLLPDDVAIQHGLRRGQRVDLIVGFVKEREHLARNIQWLVTNLPPEGAFWVAWPKKASKIASDMTERAVRDVALPIGWVDVKVCAIDNTWSALKLVLRKELRPHARNQVRTKQTLGPGK